MKVKFILMNISDIIITMVMVMVTVTVLCMDGCDIKREEISLKDQFRERFGDADIPLLWLE